MPLRDVAGLCDNDASGGAKIITSSNDFGMVGFRWPEHKQRMICAVYTGFSFWDFSHTKALIHQEMEVNTTLTKGLLLVDDVRVEGIGSDNDRSMRNNRIHVSSNSIK